MILTTDESTAGVPVLEVVRVRTTSVSQAASSLEGRLKGEEF